MDKKIIKFDDTKIEEGKFHHYKNPISINDIYINDIVISNKLPFGKQGFKYFIGYKDNKKIRPLYILFPKHKRYFDKTKYKCFMIEEGKAFDKYMEILEKVSNTAKRNLMVNLYMIKNK